MDNDVRLSHLRLLLGIKGWDEDELLNMFLSIAAQKVLDRAFPFQEDVKEVPRRYHLKQVEIAAYLYNKQGAEGQTAHTENGITRTYGSADVPEAMLRGIVPHVKVMG